MTKSFSPVSGNRMTSFDHYLDYLEGIQKDKEKTHQVIGTIFEGKKEDTLVELPDIHRRLSLKTISRSNSILSNSTAGSVFTLTKGIPEEDHTAELPPNLFKGYDHATWYVSNAKQTASYFVNCFGFEWFAYKGLETGSKIIASHVVKNGNIIFEFISPIVIKGSNSKEQRLLDKMFEFIKKHGDGVKDISFSVEDVDKVYKNAVRSGAKPVSEPMWCEDSYGAVKTATIEVFDDVYHTLIQREFYEGLFLPGYVKNETPRNDYLNDIAPVKLEKIDHCVQNEEWNTLEATCNTYAKIFGFHKFWSVDEKDVSTEYSALRSIVMASENDEIKMPINEPAQGICKSQIEEFLEYYNGPGVQHIAVLTDDIVETVGNMKKRGAQFIKVPTLYYEKLLPRLLKTGVELKEDLGRLKELGILIDFDSNGYLLQIFTKPLTDRPTFFLEVIQRHNHSGFGKGNFKALFETIEAEQRLRGTLEK